MTGGRPGVLHGNRTYLLQDDDGQILEGHSISAGLDYPGIGPEHSWLQRHRPRHLCAGHRRGGAGRLPAPDPLEGIIPALEPAHALAHVDQARADDGQGPDHRDESLRPRRQGRLHRRQASWDGRFERHDATRIDRRFADLQGRGPPGARHLRHGRRSRLRHLAAILKALPAAGADVIELGMPFSDPMADGPAIQAAGLRALKAGQTLTKTLAMVRAFREDDDDDADRADGLLQSDLFLRQRALPRRCQGRRRRRPDRRRPAAGGRRRALPAGAGGAGSTSSAWRRRPPTTSACRRCSPTPRASSTTSRSPASPARAAPDTGTSRRGGGTDQAAHHIAGRGRLRRQDGRAGARPSARTADGVVVGSALVVGGRGLARRRRPGDGGNRRRGRRAGRRARRRACAARAPRRRNEGSGFAVNWINNVVRPKIRSFLAQAGGAARTSGSSVPRPARWSSTATSRRTSSSSPAPATTCA